MERASAGVRPLIASDGWNTSQPAAFTREPGGLERLLPRGLRYMVAGAFCFSVMSLLVKVAGQRLPSQEIVFARSLVMALLCRAALARGRARSRGRKRKLLVLRGLFGFGSLSGFYYGVVHLPLADATVIQYTNAVFTAAFAVFVLHERMGRRELLCLAGAVTGLVIVARPSFLFPTAQPLPTLPLLVALGGACFSGAAYVTVRKIETEQPLVVIYYFSVISVLGSLPALLRHGLQPTALELLVLLGVGLTTQGGQLFLTKALYLERAGKVSATGVIQIVFAAAWGALLFREYPDGFTLAGAVLIVGSILAAGQSGKALAPVPGSPSIAFQRP